MLQLIVHIHVAGNGRRGSMGSVTRAQKMSATSSESFTSIAISGVEFTDTVLGRGSDATVYEVDWKGTQCAAKRLHEILLEDNSPGGVDRIIRKFEEECLTWSKLRHPAVVQFLGVYREPRSRLPVLILEKMDTSLRTYLETQSKDKFPLNLKSFILRQVSQALVYLHGQELVHHDLTTNNVLLNTISFAAKVTDFGMSNAANPHIRISSGVKGTVAFMSPEALQIPPYYDDKLDVFSFGNVILSTLTHEWPEPAYHMKQGEAIVALTEFQRREAYITLLDSEEKKLFLRLIEQCLEQRYKRRPGSMFLLQELKHIESNLPKIDSPFIRCERALRERDEAIYQRDEAVRERNEAIRQRDVESSQRAAALDELRVAISNVSAEHDDVIEQKDAIIQEKQSVIQSREIFIRGLEAKMAQLENELRQKEDVIRQNRENIQQRNEAIRQKDEAIKQKDDAIMQLKEEIDITDGEIRRLRHRSISDSGDDMVNTVSLRTWKDWEVIEIDVVASSGLVVPLSDLPAQPGGNPVNRNWTTLKLCQRTIQHKRYGGRYNVLAIRSDGSQLSVAEGPKVHILSKDYCLMTTLGEGSISFSVNLWGLAFDLKQNILVSDLDNNRVCRVSQKNTLLQTISCSKRSTFKHPGGVAVDADGRIFICDSGNHCVSVHSESGSPLHSFGSSGKADTQFNYPSDLDCSPDHHLYIADTFNSRICVYHYNKKSVSSKFVRCFRTKYEPTCIAYAAGNHLIVTAMQSDAVMVYNTRGNLVHEFGGRDQFRAPTGVAVDAAGMVYISDSLNDHIQVF